jgi:hypothetical protein
MKAVFVIVSKEHDALTVLWSPLPQTNEEWATWKILLEKDVPDETTVVDRQGCYNLGHMVIPAPIINKLTYTHASWLDITKVKWIVSLQVETKQLMLPMALHFTKLSTQLSVISFFLKREELILQKV